MSSSYSRPWHIDYKDGPRTSKTGLCHDCAESYLWEILGLNILEPVEEEEFVDWN